jgi:hypothetical protein
MGRTVEKYSKTNSKKGITRAAHHSIPAFGWWVGLLKILLDQTQRKESQRAAHHSIPAFRWELGGTVEKYS